jgi:hypothetical protein
MSNLESELRVLERMIPVGLEDALKKSTLTKIDEINKVTFGYSTFISTDTIKADCELLARLQSEFLNVNFIFTNERDVTPFIHLFKDDNEGVALYLKHDTELLTEEEFEEMQSFSIDERIEILITAIKSRLAKIGASKDNKYVLCYGGSDSLKDMYGDSTFFKPKIVHRLSILEIKY